MSTFRLRHTDRIVAAFLLAVLATLALSVLLVVRNHQMWKRRFEYRTIFDDGGGLKPETPVRIAGIEVGSVRSVTLTADNRVEVVFDVLEEYADRLREDSPDGSCARSKSSLIETEEQRKAAEEARRGCGSRVSASVPAGLGAFLPTSGLIILVGNKNNPPLRPGGLVPADESEGLADLVARLQKEGMVQSAGDIVVQVDALLKSINDPAGPFQQTLRAVAEVTGRAAKGSGLVGELTRDDSPAHRSVMASLDKLDRALGDLQSAATHIQQVSASVAGRDEELQAFITRLVAFSEDARRVGEDLAELAAQTKTLPVDVRQAVTNLNGRIDDIGVVIGGLKNTFPFNMVADTKPAPTPKQRPVAAPPEARTGTSSSAPGDAGP